MHPGFAIGGVLLLCLVSGFALHLNGYEHFDPDDFEQVELRARTTIAALDPGAPLDSVTGPLGAPDFTDMFSVDNETWRVLRYRTQRVRADGKTTRDETTALVFRSGRLVGVGDEAITRLPPATQQMLTQSLN